MFEVIWEDNKLREKENQKVLDEINAYEKVCEQMPIACYEINGWWGIWSEMGNVLQLVNPQYLVSSIYKDDIYYLFDTPREDAIIDTPSGNFYVDIRLHHHVFEWQIYNSSLAEKIMLSFTFDEYLDRIYNCMYRLLQVWREDKPIAYDSFYAELNAVEMCWKQIMNPCTLPTHYMRLAEDIRVEQFTFHFDNKDERYTIGIGNREFQSFLTDWDMSYEKIRYELEGIAFSEKAEVRLTFDMCDTVVTMKKVNVVEEVNSGDKGVGYKYKLLLSVMIEPNEFVHMTILKGYCDMKETVRTFYEGLLKKAVSPRLIEYNKIKSPIIEAFLREETMDQDDSYFQRQVHVKHVLRIDPDYDVIGFDEEDVAWGDLEDIYDQQGRLIELPDLVEWAQEMHPIVVASETSEPYEKDWADYHRRGLELAQQLRRMASTDFDIWYEAPFEDESGTIPRRMLII